MLDLERILAEREELYRRADASINTSGRSVAEVIEECLQTLQPRANA
jgi:shikimate kinase